MAAIQAAGELVVAVPPDSPPFAYSEGETGPQGFLVQLAGHIADELEVEARYIEAPPEDMAGLVAGDDPSEIGDEEVDVAFPLTTITFEIYREASLEQGFDVTTPYFVGHQRLLVPEGPSIESTDDLAGKRVCSFIDPAFGVPLEAIQPAAEVQEATSPEECGRALSDKAVDAAVATEVDLLVMLAVLDEEGSADQFEIVGDQLATQGYAPYVVKGMASFTSGVLTEVKEDGRWSEAYASWIGDLSGVTNPEPPELTLEEAAALFPLED